MIERVPNTEGMKVLINGSNDINEFAESILILVNMKCSNDYEIIDVQTLEGTNYIRLIMTEPQLNLMELNGKTKFGEIISREPIKLYDIDIEEHLKESVSKEIFEQFDKYLNDNENEKEPYVFISDSEFM